MKTIATHEAKTHLSRYLKEVSEGESFIIARGRTPIAKLVPLSEGYNSITSQHNEPMQVGESAIAPLQAQAYPAPQSEHSRERSMKRFFSRKPCSLKSEDTDYPKRDSLYER